MGRPPLPLGTWGKVRVREIADGRYQAIAKYRDYDGITRPVERVGESRKKAENNLLEALRDRSRRGGEGEITPETKVRVAAEMWLRSIDESDKAARTKREYRDTWDRYLAHSMGSLRIREVKVSTVNRMITRTRDSAGRGAASHVKVVLSGVFALVVRYDAIERNPVREIDSLGQRKRKKERAINARNIGDVLGTFHASPKAERWDLIDLVDVLSGLGCRIGELLALDWRTGVDFAAGTVSFHGTAVRVTGYGLYVQDHTKSLAGMRTVRPPAWVMGILKRRYGESTSVYVFPSATGTLRDPDNTRGGFRQVLAGTSFEGAHPHDFRHYVADVLDKAGLGAREIADYLGHDRISTTYEDYMERGVVGEDAGQALAERPSVNPPKRKG